MTTTVVTRRGVTIRHLLKPVLIAGLVAIGGLALFETMLTPIIHRQRQEHLVSDFLDRRPSIGVGDALAVLQIPAIDFNSIVAEGDSRGVLRGGPGHVPSTPAPGESGNSVIVGKSSRYGSPFDKLDKLTEGDAVFVQVRGGATSEFLVRQVAHLHDGEPLPTSDAPTELTLVTSEGGLFSGGSVAVVATPSTATTATGAGTQPPVVLRTPRSAQQVLAVPIWLGAVVVLLALAKRMRRVVTLVPVLVAVGPMVAYAALRLMFAFDVAFPATH